MPRMTARRIRSMKSRGQRIPVVTAYDYTFAHLADRAGFPVVLVGDSLGMVSLGYDSTIPVTMDDMVRHTKAVVRGTEHALVVTDMPFMSFQPSLEEAMKNAGRLVQEGGAQSVKLEGAGPTVEKVRRIVEAGIPVMGHLGLTPQSVHQFGGYRVQGKARNDALRLLKDAKALEEAGAFALVLELVPAPLARVITPEAFDPHHRYWRRSPLRRPGPGHPRYPRPLRRFRPQAHPAATWNSRRPSPPPLRSTPGKFGTARSLLPMRASTWTRPCFKISWTAEDLRVVTTVSEMVLACAELPRPLGLVPTMGYLHPGHLSLVRRARNENASVAATIFVNPTQFGSNEDLTAYPRDVDKDLAALKQENVDLVFVPDASELYPPGMDTWVEVGAVAQPLEGAHRPGTLPRRRHHRSQALKYHLPHPRLPRPKGRAAGSGAQGNG